MRVRSAFLLPVAVLSVALCTVQAQAPKPAGRTLVRAGHLLDVHTGKMLDRQTIVVEGENISSIAPTASVAAAAGRYGCRSRQ